MNAMKSAAPIQHLAVNHGVAAIQFYEAAFGAVCNSKHLAGGGKRIRHADLTFGSGTIFLNDDFPEFEDRVGKTPMQLGECAMENPRIRSVISGRLVAH
jgi:uncharacterized glyoxalase superfamily protein PhnB